MEHRDTVRRRDCHRALLAAVEELGPLWRSADGRARPRRRHSRFENLAEAKEAGLHRLTVPQEYGGFGYWIPGNFSGLYRILERMAYWDTNTAQLLQVHNHAAGILAISLVATRSASASCRRSSMVRISRRSARRRTSTRTERSRWPPNSQQSTAATGLTARKAFASVAAIAKYLMVWCAVEGDSAYAGRGWCSPSCRPTRPVFSCSTTGRCSACDRRCRAASPSTMSSCLQTMSWASPADGSNNDPRTFSCGYASNHLGTAQGAFDFIAGYVASRDDLSSF